jgi:hypothetical protein
VARTEGTGVWRHAHRSLAGPPATPEHGSSSAGAQQRERNTGNSARASPGLGRRCGDGREMEEERKFGNSGARASKEGESEMGEVR